MKQFSPPGRSCVCRPSSPERRVGTYLPYDSCAVRYLYMAGKPNNQEISMNCEYCSVEHDGSYGSGRFCNPKCARGFATRSKRKEINEKVSKTLTLDPYVKSCPQCSTKFETKKKHKKYCSRSCWYESPEGLETQSRNGKVGGKRSAYAQRQSRRSKNEEMFASLCEAHFGNVLCNEPMFNGWDADVILPDLKVAVHWNGPWHYKKIAKQHSVKQVQNRDKLKCVNVERAGYNNYVIRDDGKHNPSFVKEEFEKFLRWTGSSIG